MAIADLERIRTAVRLPLRRLVPGLIVLVLLGQMGAAMAVQAVQQTPTTDEPVYVGTAVDYLREHILRYNPEHPPLGKLIIEAGVAFAGLPPVAPRSGEGQWQFGRRVIYHSGVDPYRVMLFARLPMILLTLLFGLVVFLFARDLAGRWAGVVALACYALSPDVLAHGSLATLDVPMAGFLLTSLWLLWRARFRPMLYLPLAGLALGAALATKMAALPAVPVVLALAALAIWPHRPGRTAPAIGPPGPGESAAAVRSRPLGEFAAAIGPRRLAGYAVAVAGVGVIAVATVWLCYIAVDPRLRRVAPAHLPSFGGIHGILIDLLPFPRSYRDGMRIQLGIERETFHGFLFGQTYSGSRWYYLPAALLVKTPLGLIALWFLGAAALLWTRRLRPAFGYVVALPVIILLANLDGARNFGVRYVIVWPVVLAVAAGAAVVFTRARILVAVLVLALAVSSARAFPYYLTYSNEAFGGPSQTYLRLHDSNVDWGQDLGRLADRLRERYPGQPVWLDYKGNGDPAAYGIHAADPLTVPPDRVHGLLVVSRTKIAQASAQLRALIDTSTPIDQVGNSIAIYRRP